MVLEDKIRNTKRKNYLYFDSFQRDNSLTSAGNSEIPNSEYTVAGNGNSPVFGIIDNQMYCVSGTSANRAVIVKDHFESDGVFGSKVNGIGANSGIAFRYTDIHNFWLFTMTNNAQVNLTKYVAGIPTEVARITKTFGEGELIVAFKGKKIEVFVDGFLQATVYDDFNMTATQHGAFTRTDAPNFRWDYMYFQPYYDVPFKVKDDFETGTIRWFWKKEIASAVASHALTFSSDIKKSGAKSLRVELNASDPEADHVGKHRSELRLEPEAALEEHWYGVSIYLPNGGTEDYQFDTEPDCLIQWHTTPDNGEENVSPPLALFTEDGKYYIYQRWDEGRMSRQATIKTYYEDLGSYEADKGRWVDWVFHVKWGWMKEHEPITEVYKDGVLVYENNGVPNAMNDTRGVYAKLGVYKWPWDANPVKSIATKRVVYFDDFWMK